MRIPANRALRVSVFRAAGAGREIQNRFGGSLALPLNPRFKISGTLRNHEFEIVNARPVVEFPQLQAGRASEQS